jgi:1-acyl-sn-glycerol-3-phosphate acyltransferase
MPSVTSAQDTAQAQFPKVLRASLSDRLSAPDFGKSLAHRDPEAIRRWMPLWDWAYRVYFRAQTQGWEKIPAGPALFVGSHNGGLATPDMLAVLRDWYSRFEADRPIYGLMHRNIWRGAPALAYLAEQCGAIEAHPKAAIAALQAGASVLVYPGGGYDVFRPHSQRHRIHLAGNQGFVKLALRHGVPIVPVVSTGAHDTLIVLADLYPIVRWFHDNLGIPWFLGLDPEVFPIYLGLPWGLGIGPLPNIPFPMQIKTSVGEPIYFDRQGGEASRDRAYVQECFDRVEKAMQQQLDDMVANP